MKKIKVLIFAAVSVSLLFACVFQAFAGIRPYSESGEIISISHLGDSYSYPANSLEGIKSAFNMDADCVSVRVKKTADGQFVLALSDDLGEISPEGAGLSVSTLNLDEITALHLKKPHSEEISEYTVSDLDSVITVTRAYNKTLIIDFDWDDRTDLFSFLTKADALDNAAMRTDVSVDEVQTFMADTSGKCPVISSYFGNIVFNARNTVKKSCLACCAAVELGSKNGFGVVFRSPVQSAFGTNGFATRALAVTCDSKKSGGRPDTRTSWDELIDAGFSMIETDRTADLTAYINDIENARAELIEISQILRHVNTEKLTSAQLKDLTAFNEESVKVFSTLSSYKTITQRHSESVEYLNIINNLSPDDTRGQLTFTPGRITAAALGLFGFIAVQVFFYRRRADKRKV